MQIHDLGSLWAESEGLPIALKGKRLASALSVLLVHRREKVRADLLIESIWASAASARQSAALDTLLWRLRAVLDPGRSARTSSEILRTEDQGYRLDLPDDAVDSWNFDAMARAIGKLRDASAVLELSEAALALWRGRPYEDVDDNGWLDVHRARLLEQHLRVQEARIDALLEVGRPEQAVAELVPVLSEHPFIERLWCFRILGLYRSGRIKAALEAYAEVSELLDRELAMTPGPELVALRERILRHDRSLAGPRGEAARGAIRIPIYRTSLVGRDDDVSAVAGLLYKHGLVTVTGPVGCGKTRLATAVADQVKGRFPDGVCFVDLSDVADGTAVADRVQETLHADGDPIGSATGAVADYLAERELLLVLDNCELVVSSALALAGAVLAAGGPARILATSRRVLGARNEAIHLLRPLETPLSASPDDLGASAAAQLFVDRAASRGIVIDLTGPHASDVARICRALDGLPLGIELAAARTQVFQLHEIAASVVRNPMALATLAGGRQAHGERNLRESIDSSYRVLTDQERTAHRRLSALPSRFTLEAAVAACTGEQLPADEVPDALIGLVGQSLLEATRPERPHGPSLFRQLVPIRAHAAHLLTQEGETEDVHAALLTWIGEMLAAGPRIGQSDGGALDVRLQDNRRTITAALENAIRSGPSDGVLISLCRLVPYWWLDGKLSPETVRLVSAAAEAVGQDNDAFTVAVVRAANMSFVAINRSSEPTPSPGLLEAIGRVGEAPYGLEVFAAELLVSIAASCWMGGDLPAAEAAAAAVAAYSESLDDDHLRVLAKGVRCAMGLHSDPGAASQTARCVLDESLAVGNTSAAIMCYHTLYMAALFMHDGEGGLHWNAEAIRAQREIGQRNAPTTLEARGSLHVLMGDPHDAIRAYGASNFQHSRLGRSWPQLPGTAELLDRARSQVTPEEFDQAWASGERMAASDLVGLTI